MGHVVPDTVPFYTSEIFGPFFRRMLDAELMGTCPLQIWGTLLSGGHTPRHQGPGKTAEFEETFSFPKRTQWEIMKNVRQVCCFLITDCTCRSQFKSIELLQIIVKGIMGGASSDSRLQSSSGKRLSIVLTVSRMVSSSGSLTDFNLTGRLIEDGQVKGVWEI